MNNLMVTAYLVCHYPAKDYDDDDDSDASKARTMMYFYTIA